MTAQHHLVIDSRLFAAASQWVGNEPTRYYLHGVYVAPDPAGGARLVTTDGHRMIVIRAPQAIVSETPFILRMSKALEKPAGRLKQTKALPADPVLTVRDGRMEIDGISAPAEFIDGTFPDYARVIPGCYDVAPKDWDAPGELLQPPKFGGAAFNATYLAGLAPVGRLLRAAEGAGNEAEPVIVTAIDDSTAALITWGGVENAFGILMPIRAKPREAKVPAWFRATAKPAAAAENLEAAE